MSIFLLLFCFTGIFLNLGLFMEKGTGKKDILIFSVLIFSALVVIINELLSLFSAINFLGVFLSWVVILMVNFFFLYPKRTAAIALLKQIKHRFRDIYGSYSRYEKVLFYAVSGILILVLAQGIIYPPNNWDSMTYHLARINSWISRGSIEHFPTHIFYQVYQPPFAEYVVMHFNILARGDYFSNTVQFFFLLFTLITLTSIFKALGLPRKYQFVTLVFAGLMPEILLQASTTQNNIVEAFLVLTAYYLTLKALSELKLRNYFFLGLAGGLALLTKATANIYLFPILLVFGINLLIKLFKTKNYKYLWCGAIVLLTGFAINCRQYQRNYNFSKSIFGTPESEKGSYTNVKMNPVLLLSNIVKNAGLQMNVMGTTKPSEVTDSVIRKLHTMAGVQIDGFDNNFAVAHYSTPVGGVNHEDGASNPFHFILMVIAFIMTAIYYIKTRKDNLMGQLLLIAALQVVLFCWVLKWQPWNTRMHIQFFVISMPVFCYALGISKWFRKLAFIVMPVIVLYAFVLVLHNAIRPYIVVSKVKPYFSTNLPIFDSRFKKYFANVPLKYPEYQKVNNAIQAANYKNIGLILGFNDYQYPLFADCYSRELNPVHIFVTNDTRNLKNIFTTVDCIVSTTVNKPFIDYNGRRFYNKSSNNKYIYLYE